MSGAPKKRSGGKTLALIISIGLHAAAAFYLGRMALDYALPKGEVTSIEMNIDTPQGETTAVDVVQSAPTPPAPEPVAPPKPEPVKAKPTPKPVAQKPAAPKTLPSKEAIVEDKQGEMPVETTEIAETPAVDPIPAEEPKVEEAPAPQEEPVTEQKVEAPPAEVAAAPVAESAATSAPAAAAPSATDQGYGTPVGNPSENLIPYGNNRKHTYPYMARLRRIEGTTLVQYTVAPSGEVSEAKILQSSGQSVLDSEAVDTIKRWKFKPMKSEVTYEKEVVFRFKGEATPAPSKLRRAN